MSLLLCLPTSGYTEDIEIYNTTRALTYQPSGHSGTIAPPNPNYPNVLFVLDASLSMGRRDPGFNKSRIARLREAMSTVLNNAQQINVGIMRFSHRLSGGRIIYPMSPIEYAREDALEVVSNMSLEFFTPTVGAVLESLLYYTGRPVYYGTKRLHQQHKNHRFPYHGRVSHPESYTGGRVIRPRGCTEANPNHPSCVEERIVENPVYISPILSECQQNYQVVITEGGATGRVDIDYAERIMGRRCHFDHSKRSDTCSVELAEYLATEDQSTTVPGINTVNTYTVGFNVRLETLKQMANAGGGAYFESSSADQLANALTTVLTDVSAPPAAFSPPAINVDPDAVYANRNDIHLALFEPAITPLWPGNLKGYWLEGQLKDYNVPRRPALSAGGSGMREGARSQWSVTADGNNITEGGAASKIRPSNKRIVATNRPGGSSQLTHESNRINARLVTATQLDLPDRSLSLGPQHVAPLIDWINGIDVKDQDSDGNTRENRNQYGDPLHSNPSALFTTVSHRTITTPLYFSAQTKVFFMRSIPLPVKTYFRICPGNSWAT